MTRRSTPWRQQTGAALLTAMVIVTLIATLAAAMVWQQYRAIQIEAAERARSQASWILMGALDFGRLILREDARTNINSPIDHLGEVWAVPLAESRVSTFLAVDKDNTAENDGPEAFLSGSIEDLQARFNLRNLTTGQETPAAELATLARLCSNAGIPAATATTIANGLRAAVGSPSAGDTNDPGLIPQRIAQLTWLGVDPAAIAKLRPWITLLPSTTPVNINTAPREVLAALVEGMDLASAERLVRVRQNAPFKTLDDAQKLIPTIKLEESRVAVKTDFFEILSRLRLDERMLEERAVVNRRGMEVIVVNRYREPSVTEAR